MVDGFAAVAAAIIAAVLEDFVAPDVVDDEEDSSWFTTAELPVACPFLSFLVGFLFLLWSSSSLALRLSLFEDSAVDIVVATLILFLCFSAAKSLSKSESSKSDDESLESSRFKKKEKISKIKILN